MKRTGRTSPNFAGIASALLIAALVYFAFVRTLPGAHDFTLHGRFSSSEGVIVGAPVREAGVNVGKVTSVSRAPRGQADIGFSLGSSARPVFADARLRLRPRLFLEGGFYVELSPGSPGGGAALRDGATVPEAQTSVAVQNDQILTTFTAETRASGATILHELARSLRGGGARDLNAITRALPPALRHGAIAGQASLGTSPDDLSNLVRNSAQIASTLDQHRDALETTITAGTQVNQVFAQHAADLQALFTQAERLLDAAPPTLHAIDVSLPAVDGLLRALRPALPGLPGALVRTRRLLDELGVVTRPGALPRLLTASAPTINRTPTLLRRTAALMPLVDSVSACAVTHILPTLDAKLDDGPLSTGRPVWQDLLHAATALAGTAQDFDANGPWSRFQGGVSNYVVSTGQGPSVGNTVGQVTLPLLGTRPHWNGPVPPPFHPEAPCAAQPATSLAASAGPVEQSTPITRAARRRGR